MKIAVMLWCLLLLMVYSYYVFPIIIKLLALAKKRHTYGRSLNRQPFISVIVSAYNEQSHIRQKVLNILQSDYPVDKFEIIVGSDGSTDDTNKILLQLAREYPQLKPLFFSERRGKSSVLNDCVSISTGEFLVLTDAKAMFDKDTIQNLISNFGDERLGIVGATIINGNRYSKGIARQESIFMSYEILVKNWEGQAFGATIGIYGACYAIRRELFAKIPSNYAVDDFFVSMKVLEKGYKVILDLNSKCYENVTSRLTDEYKRKVRIGVGNMQNMRSFMPLLLKCNAISFCYFSHKIIRWLGPFLLMVIFILSLFLWNAGLVYKILLIIQLLSMLISVAIFYQRKFGLQIIFLRFVAHFYIMNLALFVGFLKYIIGVKANVWEPTNR